MKTRKTHTKEAEELYKPTKLVCVCGKHFDTVEMLHEHKANCREFQAKQDLDAKKESEKVDFEESI